MLEVDNSLCPCVVDREGILDSNSKEFTLPAAVILGKIHYATSPVACLNLEDPPAETLLVHLKLK